MANKLLNDSKILENGDVLNSPKFPVTVISQHKAQNPSIVVNGTVKAQRKCLRLFRHIMLVAMLLLVVIIIAGVAWKMGYLEKTMEEYENQKFCKDGEVKTDVNDLDGLRSVLESMNKTVNKHFCVAFHVTVSEDYPAVNTDNKSSPGTDGSASCSVTVLLQSGDVVYVEKLFDTEENPLECTRNQCGFTGFLMKPVDP